MSLNQDKGASSRAGSTCPGKNALAELQALLAEQLSLAEKGRFDQVAAMMSRAEQCLSEVSACELPEGNEEAGDRIRELYDKLRLVLAATKQEVARDLRKIRLRRSSVRAYLDAMKPR